MSSKPHPQHASSGAAAETAGIPDVRHTAAATPGLVSRYFRSRAFGWTLVAALLVTWQIVATLHTMPELPPLDAIAVEWWEQATQADLLTALLDTLRVAAIGYVIATLVGVSLGFLMGRVRVIWGLAEPVVELIRQVPVTALLPLLFLYLGIEDRLRITVVVIIATFPILLNSYAGARSLSRTMKLTARTFQLSWWRTQIEIGLPAALPFILVGMRQALGMTLVISVVTGMLAGNSGIGYFILQAQQVLNVRALFAGVITVAFIGYGLNALFLLLDRRLTRWRNFGAAED